MEQLSISEMAAGFVGIVVPFVVQLVRSQLLPELSAKYTMLMSLGVAVACTAVAYYNLDKTPTPEELAGNIGVAFTLSQVVYRQFEATLKGEGKEPPAEE